MRAISKGYLFVCCCSYRFKSCPFSFQCSYIFLQALGNSGGRKGKKSLSNNKKDKSGLKKSKSKTASKFDFTNVPPKVDWVLTDSSKGSWTPFINEQKVPESDKRVWTAAFAAEDNGGPMS